MTQPAEEQASTDVQQAVEARQERDVLIGFDGKPNANGWRKIGERLRAEMPTKTLTAGRRGTFSYITARQVAQRLDNVVGPGNWSTAFLIVDRDTNAVECTLSIFGVPKSDVGYPNNTGENEEAEGLKSAYSDAFKRAAVQWGIGRFLYGDT